MRLLFRPTAPALCSPPLAQCRHLSRASALRLPSAKRAAQDRDAEAEARAAKHARTIAAGMNARKATAALSRKAAVKALRPETDASKENPPPAKKRNKMSPPQPQPKSPSNQALYDRQFNEDMAVLLVRSKARRPNAGDTRRIRAEINKRLKEALGMPDDDVIHSCQYRNRNAIYILNPNIPTLSAYSVLKHAKILTDVHKQYDTRAHVEERKCLVANVELAVNIRGMPPELRSGLRRHLEYNAPVRLPLVREPEYRQQSGGRFEMRLRVATAAHLRRYLTSVSKLRVFGRDFPINVTMPKAFLYGFKSFNLAFMPIPAFRRPDGGGVSHRRVYV